MDFKRNLARLLDDLGRFLTKKNEKYGNSALEPVRIFSKADVYEQLRVRIDDKLSRLALGQDEDEDVMLDLWGYLTLWLLQERNEGKR